MKRTFTVFTMIAMMTVLLLPQTGVAQDETTTDRQSARTMQMENRLLIAINSAGLSLEQLQTIHAGIAPIQAAKADAEAAQEAMHDFLVNWTGDAEAFEEIQATAQAAFENVRTQMEAFQETIGDTLTANQAEAFRAALGSQRGFGNRDGATQQQRQGERGPRFGGPGNDEQGGRPGFQGRGPGGFGQRGPGARGPQGPGMLGAIDVLDAVLSAKIEALQNQ